MKDARPRRRTKHSTCIIKIIREKKQDDEEGAGDDTGVFASENVLQKGQWENTK